jgi:hypothetical protein
LTEHRGEVFAALLFASWVLIAARDQGRTAMRARARLFPRLAAILAATLAACGTPPANTADDASKSGGAAASGAPASGAAGSEAAQSAAAPADGYVFKKKLPAVGSRFAETETTARTLALVVDRGNPDGTEHRRERSTREVRDKTVEVLATNAEAVTKVKVTYKDYSKVEKKDANETASQEPVIGKSYVVEAKDGTVSVLSDTGSKVSAEEEKAVNADFKSLGKPDAFQKGLPDTPIKIGDTVDSLAQALEERFRSGGLGTKASISNVTVKLVKVNDDGAMKSGVFEFTLDLRIDMGTAAYSRQMAGQVEVRMDDGMTLAYSVKAPSGVTSRNGMGGRLGLDGTSATEMSRKPL